MAKKWQIAKKISSELQARFPEFSALLIQLLFNRGLQAQQPIDEFLHPDYSKNIHDPFLFRGMKTAVDRIFSAIEKHEHITIHGDYDADGVTATVIPYITLKTLGADVDVYIPHRVTEGYGLNSNTVNELAKKGTKLIITVDCGISSQPEIALASKKEIDVIVTDHHEQPPELPAALTIINPHVAGETYPFTDLSGSGVSFKLVSALVMEASRRELYKGLLADGFEKWLLDLVAIGTIADCVPILGENRTLVKYGLVVLKKSRRVGLVELAKSARVSLPSVDTNAVSFSLVPRLNAAGRIDHANTAFELLVTDRHDEAESIAASLEKTNQQRQRTTEQMVNESKKQIGDAAGKKLLYAIGPGWSPGIVGLVAGRLMDVHHRPVLIMGEKENVIVGSGRSIPGFDITKALVEARKFLDRFGGHAAACGFTLDKKNLKNFLSSVTKQAERLTEDKLTKSLFVDAEIPLAAADWELVGQLDQFEPFGEGNKRPRFASFGLTLIDFQGVGQDGKHLRLQVQQQSTTRKMIGFSLSEKWVNELTIGGTIDAVYELSVNEWNGNRELQLKLVDLIIKS
ncbi:MAG: single-stranded-DNA-specific exonuclease RecJ [Patescibacteria group bacterium]